MEWSEAVTSVAGMGSIVLILYLETVDGLRRETLVVAIIAVAGLGGYGWAKDYFDRRKE